MMRLVLPLLSMLAACQDQRPPAPSAEQAERLDDSEAMLDDLAENEEGAADRSTSPFNSSD